MISFTIGRCLAINIKIRKRGNHFFLFSYDETICKYFYVIQIFVLKYSLNVVIETIAQHKHFNFIFEAVFEKLMKCWFNIHLIYELIKFYNVDFFYRCEQ